MVAVNPRWQTFWETPIGIIRERLSMCETYFVSQGIGGANGDWFTCIRKSPGGSTKRVVSKFLPLRATREEAERDLFCWLVVVPR